MSLLIGGAVSGASNPLHVLNSSPGFTVTDLVTRARFDPVVLAVVGGAGVWYFRSWRRARGTAGAQPTWRAATFAWGLVVIVAATVSGSSALATTNVVAHMTNDALLVMVAPILLVLGSPLRVGLAGAGARSTERVWAALASPAARALTHPVVSWILLAGCFLALYFSGLYQATVEHRAVADAVDLVLLAAGLLFCWPAVAADPVARPSGFPVRLATVFMALPMFTLLAMALGSQRTPIAPGSSVDSLHLGGDVLWGLGSMLAIAGAVGVLISWVRAEAAAAQQRDKTADPEADAQLALWRADRAAAAMEDTLARATVVKARPGPDPD